MQDTDTLPDLDALASAALDASAPEPADGGNSAGAEPGEPAGRARDDQGRFAPAADTPADAPAATPAAPVDPATADAPATPGSAPAITAADTPAPTPDAGQPFVFRASGAEHTLDGATLRADGALVVPAAALPRAQQLLAAGREYETTGQRRLQEMARAKTDAEQRFSAKEARADAITATFEQLMERPVAEIVDFFDHYLANKPLLQAQIERETAQRELAAARQLRAPSPEESESQAQQVVDATRTSYMDEAARAFPELGACTAEEREAIGREAFGPYLPYIVRPMTADEARQYGGQVGTPVVDTDRFATVVKQQAQLRTAPRAAAEQARAEAAARAKAQADAAKSNAQRTGAPAGNRPPPVAGGTPGSSTPAAARPEGAYASREEWRRAHNA